MSKKPTHTCALCGAKTVEYRHGLNRLLVRALQIAWRVSEAGAHQFKVSDNEAFSYSERCNFQKLRYWGFVRRAMNTQGEPKEGWWHLTDAGLDFLRGDATAPRYVRTLRGEVQRTIPDGELVLEITIAKVDPAWQIPRRADFAKGARPPRDERQLRIF